MRYLKRLFSIRARDLMRLDYLLIVCILALTVFGGYNIYKATQFNFGSHYVKMQLVFTMVGIIAAIIIICMDYTKTMPLVNIFYGVTIALLIGVLFMPKRNGITGWFNLGFIAIQPAELAKLAVVMMASKILHNNKGNINSPKVFGKVFLAAIIPVGLMVLQPEMGITMITFFAVLFMVYVCGLRLWVIIGGFLTLAGGIFAMIKFNLLHGLWRQRILMMFSTNNNELDEAFQVSTGLTAIGSGSVMGATNPGYFAIIPEVHTDMIFAVIAENFGFLGSALLIVVYCIVLLRIISIAKQAKDVYGRCLASGIFGIFFFSILQNIGMTLRIMPISGITLPFVSYGGSSMITNIVAIAIVLNVGMRKKKTTIG